MAQNFKNHARYVPLLHFVLYPLVVYILVTTIINLVMVMQHGHHGRAAYILLPMSVALLLLAFFTRSFPLKTQDRAIRAEENLRHFVLTGKLLDPRLRLGQIIALRFASDEEFPKLAIEAAEKNLDGKTIKKLIVNWREDNNRV